MTDIITEELQNVAECVIATASQHTSVAGFSWKVRFSESVRNTHSAPQSGVRNFTGDPDLPTGYPGFSGRVWIRYGDMPKRPGYMPGSDPFCRSLTYTGTGGSGGYNGPWTASYSQWHRHKNVLSPEFPEPMIYSWDYKFFLADWPELEKIVAQQRLLDSLVGENWAFEWHRYLWTDPEYIERDRKIDQKISLSRGVHPNSKCEKDQKQFAI